MDTSGTEQGASPTPTRKAPHPDATPKPKHTLPPPEPRGHNPKIGTTLRPLKSGAGLAFESFGYLTFLHRPANLKIVLSSFIIG